MLSTLGAVKKRAQSCGSWWNGPSGLDWLAKPNNVWPFFFPNFFISINVYFLKKLNYIYINTSSLFYLFFRETLLNDRDFLVMCLIFEEIFPIHLWSFFIYLLYRWNIFLKIKKYLFSDDISNICSLVYYFFFFIQSI